MVLDRRLMLLARGAPSESLRHTRMPRFKRHKLKSGATSLITPDGIIHTRRASFAGMLELPAFIAWLESGLTPGAKQESQCHPHVRGLAEAR